MKHIYDDDPGIFAIFLDSRYLMVYPEEIISIIEFITDQVTQKTIKKEANIEFCQDLLKVGLRRAVRRVHGGVYGNH